MNKINNKRKTVYSGDPRVWAKVMNKIYGPRVKYKASDKNRKDY